jgi:hypothetical protein|tara:strand:- start:136 stop:384 length:249 start_codon:yes stop_codon:yes gene_type:complete
MNHEFLEEQIEATKSDLVFHERRLSENITTLEGLEVLSEVNPSDTIDRLLKEAVDSVKWYQGRIVYDNNLLDVLLTARDLSK